MSNDLRSYFLGQKAVFKTLTVDIGGKDVEVRQLSLRDRNSIIQKAKKGDEVDALSAAVYNVIFSTFDPGTGKRVFEETDFDTLMGQPSDGGWFSALIDAINKLSGDEGNVDTSTSDETSS